MEQIEQLNSYVNSNSEDEKKDPNILLIEEKRIAEEFEIIKNKTNFQISNFDDLKKNIQLHVNTWLKIDTTTCCPKNIRA